MDAVDQEISAFKKRFGIDCTKEDINNAAAKAVITAVVKRHLRVTVENWDRAEDALGKLSAKYSPLDPISFDAEAAKEDLDEARKQKKYSEEAASLFSEILLIATEAGLTVSEKTGDYRNPK